MLRKKWKPRKNILIIGVFLFAGTLLIFNSPAMATGGGDWDDCKDFYPCIDVTKECIDAENPGDPIEYFGVVTNCGTQDLFDVWLDDVTLGVPIFSGEFLEPGDTIGYSGWYIPTESPSTNTVVGGASGTETVCMQATAICTTPDGPGCRMTGGGNATAGADGIGGWDGTLASSRNGNGNNVNRYTFGGQVGANTALPPQPKGEWTHHQQRGPAGSFVFHAGTASAPPGTEIAEIICTDEGWCNPARKAPNKQLDWIGIGSFKNMKDSPLENIAEVVPGESLHCVEVHIEDLGEPGGKNGKKNGICPPDGQNDVYADSPFVDGIADCDCSDFYRIRIYKSANIDNNGTCVGSSETDDVIYKVEGYLNGGNFQIHPLTGFDQK